MVASSEPVMRSSPNYQDEICEKLIQLSFAKIVNSKSERGGARLHKNLLILHLLQKARLEQRSRMYTAVFTNNNSLTVERPSAAGDTEAETSGNNIQYEIETETADDVQEKAETQHQQEQHQPSVFMETEAVDKNSIQQDQDQDRRQQYRSMSNRDATDDTENRANCSATPVSVLITSRAEETRRRRRARGRSANAENVSSSSSSGSSSSSSDEDSEESEKRDDDGLEKRRDCLKRKMNETSSNSAPKIVCVTHEDDDDYHQYQCHQQHQQQHQHQQNSLNGLISVLKSAALSSNNETKKEDRENDMTAADCVYDGEHGNGNSLGRSLSCPGFMELTCES